MEREHSSKMRRINITLDANLHQELRVRTVIERKTISDVITESLDSYFKSKDDVKRSEDV